MGGFIKEWAGFGETNKRQGRPGAGHVRELLLALEGMVSVKKRLFENVCSEYRHSTAPFKEKAQELVSPALCRSVGHLSVQSQGFHTQHFQQHYPRAELTWEPSALSQKAMQLPPEPRIRFVLALTLNLMLASGKLLSDASLSVQFSLGAEISKILKPQKPWFSGLPSPLPHWELPGWLGTSWMTDHQARSLYKYLLAVFVLTVTLVYTHKVPGGELKKRHFPRKRKGVISSMLYSYFSVISFPLLGLSAVLKADCLDNISISLKQILH